MRICLLCEGSYPYVVGGVSSWVQMLMTGMPEHEFVLYCIGAEEKDRGNYKYKLPDNVVGVHEVFLDTVLNMNTSQRCTMRFTEEEKEVLSNLLLNDEEFDLPALIKIFRTKTNKENFLEIFMSFDFFDCILKVYREKYSYLAFTDFFWTVRSMLLPLFYILQEDLPQADLYHSVATGYCGVVGSLAAEVYNKPYLITEHGIYSREREEEIIKSDWVMGDFKAIWIEYFYQQAQIAYRYAHKVVTLFEGNANVEKSLGCDPNKIFIVPNGVRLERFLPLEREPRDGTFVIGAVVRVVPIKDIQTMIRAYALVKKRLPKSRLIIMGPYAEDPKYYQECLDLVASLKLEDVEFTGNVNIVEYMVKLDVLILSSISEGQPLSILEGLAANVPFVATDVGCCREIIYGYLEEDKFGDAGIVVPVMDFESMAEAILKMANDTPLREAMAKAGRERVKKYYGYDEFINNYRAIYKEMER